MPMAMQCPFYKADKSDRIYCEGGTLKYPDKSVKQDYEIKYCANILNYKHCTIAKCFEKYYEDR